MKKVLALILALIMGISVLAACKKGDISENAGNPNGSDSQDTPTEPAVPQVSLFGEADTFYIVYPDEGDCTPELVSKANALKTTLELMFPDMIFFAVNANKSWGDSFFEKNEILIGDTGRPESDEVIAALEDKQFAIRLAESGKLVIAGTEEGLTIEAINHFSSTYVMTAYESHELLLDENLYYTQINHNVARPGWLLYGIPSYQGGTLSKKTYANGTDRTFMNPGGKVQLVHETNPTEFNQYLADLKAAGYSEVFRHTIGNNIYVQYSNKIKLIYAYYTAVQNETKVIYENVGVTPVKDFSYSYTAKASDTTSFYQYAMMFNNGGRGGQDLTSKEYLWENASLFDIIKLADNSVILLDGGWEPMATDKAVEECMKFLREITGTPKGQKVRVAAVYFTHRHEDHIAFTKKLVEKHTNEIEVERIMHNLLPSGYNGQFDQLGKSLQKHFPNAKFLQLHTGQKIQLADVTFEVLFTQEDLYTREDLPKVTDENGYSDYDDNNSSTILKMTMNKRTFLLTGDWSGGHVNRDKYEYKGMEKTLLESMTLSDGSSYLKCDVLQIPHHAINDWIDNFIKAVDPDIAFIPQQDTSYNNYAHACFKNIISSLRKFGVKDKNIFFSGRYTYGITVALDGTMTLSYRSIAGVDAEYTQYIINKYPTFHAPQSGVVPFK